MGTALNYSGNSVCHDPVYIGWLLLPLNPLRLEMQIIAKVNL